MPRIQFCAQRSAGKTIAQVLSSVAARTNGEFPVIARHDDAYDCDKIGNMSAGDRNDILYVFTYSETSRSLCFVTYQRARETATQSRSEVLSSNSGQNYGRQL